MARVAWIGLGVMGAPMAGHLLATGSHEVVAYNRTPAKASAWAARYPGGRVAATPAEAAVGAEFVFACVGNDDDLREVTIGEHGAFQAMGAGSVFIDHTTASAQVARELAAAAAARGFASLDAPVSGGQAGAENGTLTIMAGGEAEPFRARRAHHGGVCARGDADRALGRGPAHQDGQPDRDCGAVAGAR